jgi:hypothetical protein
VDTYPCPVCGGPATAATGCRNCGRPHDPDAAALAMFQRTVASLEQKKRDLNTETVQLRGQLAHVSAQRDSLRRKVRQRVEEETSTKPASRKPLRSLISRGGGSPDTPTQPVAPTVPPQFSPRGPAALESGGLAPPAARPDTSAPPLSGPITGPVSGPVSPPSAARPANGLAGATPAARPGGRPGAIPGSRSGATPGGRPGATPGIPPGGRPGGRDAWPEPQPEPRAATTAGEPVRGAIVPPQRRAGAPPKIKKPRQRRAPGDGPEATTGSMQTAVLALGGLLLAGAAIVLTVDAFGTMSTVLRLTLLTVITAAGLATPLLLVGRGLRATAETVAAVALLLVLLDGYVVRSENLFGSRAIAETVYFGLVCLVTAAVAAAYSIQSHLVAPRYATLLALQPVLPLLAYSSIRGPAGWSLALSGAALVNLGFGVALGRPANRRPAEVAPAVSTVDDPAGPSLLANELMRDLAWLLFAVAFGAASAFAIAALATTQVVPGTLRAAAVVLIAAGIGVSGSLSWRRGPIPDIASGVATLAVIAAFARVGAVSMPGHTLLFTAGAVALAAGAIPFLPADARRGPRFAGSAALAATTLLLLFAAVPAIAAPIRAARPVWHAALGRYPEIVRAAAGPHAWQLVIAALLLTLAGALIVPAEYREDIVASGVAFTALVAPAALALSWLAAPALTVVAAVAAGALALTVRRPRTAWILLGAATLLGLYAAATSLAQPAATALTLTAITVAGAVIALAPRPVRTDPQAEMVGRRVTDGAAGGALFALPGAAAASMAILFTGVPGGATAVLVMSCLALAVSLGVAAITQVARGEQSPPLLVGATAGAVAVFIATFVAKGAAVLDIALATLMLASAAALWLAPRMDDRKTFGGAFTGSDAAAAAVTVASIAAVARATSLAAPGSELVTMAVLVFAVAVGARNLPYAWRRGPVAGGAIAGGLTGAYAGVLAVIGAVGVIRAADPPWHAQLGVPWQHNAEQLITFGWQVPIALLLLAGAAAVALPQPYGDNAASSAGALAAMAAPIGLELGWQSPMVLGWVAATGIAVWAALARSSRAAYTRLIAAGVVGAFAAGASLVRPGATAGTLLALAASSVVIAALAALSIRRSTAAPLGFAAPGFASRVASSAPETIEPEPGQAHLLVVGGTAIASGLLALAGACAAIAAGLHPGANPALVLSATLAAAGGGLAAAAVVCRWVPGYLPYVSGGVAASATIATIAALPTAPSSAVVYAAAAALLGVLAELVRAGNPRPGRAWLPARVFRPDRTRLPIRAWRQAAAPGGFTTGVAAAAGIPAAIVVIFVGPAVAAALLGPYRWINMPWTATPVTASDLGMFERYAGNGTHVLAATLLTLAAALVAVGLGGGGAAVANRSVAIIVPGMALTLLITPEAMELPWPAQPTAALLVATVAGLGLALTVPPVDSAATGLRFARRLVFVIAVLAAFAGGAGSLATRSQTLVWLGGSIVVGAIAALFGKTPLARMLGWHVAASTAEGFALAAGLAAGLPLIQCAFPVLIVAAVLMVLAAALPRLRPSETVGREAVTLEAAGYAGALLSVILTLGSVAHTAAVLTALGAILGVSAARPGRSGSHRVYLIIAASVTELIAIWLLLSIVHVALPEAYTLPFAVLALITGLIEIKHRPELGSWVAYGPALVAGFGPSLAIVLSHDSPPLRRVLLILGAVITVAVGALRRQKAPVLVGSVVTVIATLHELLAIGLPWPILLLLFVGTGVLLISLGATYEQRRRLDRLRGAFRGMR